MDYSEVANMKVKKNGECNKLIIGIITIVLFIFSSISGAVNGDNIDISAKIEKSLVDIQHENIGASEFPFNGDDAINMYGTNLTVFGQAFFEKRIQHFPWFRLFLSSYPFISRLITFDASDFSVPDEDDLGYCSVFDNDDTGVTGYSTNPISAHKTVNNIVPVVAIDDVVQPNSDFILPEDLLEFYGSYTDSDTDDTHTIEWDFGDGIVVMGTLTPTHAPANPGNYTVTLTVIDDDGGIGVTTVVICVKSPAEATNAVIENIETMDLPQGEVTSLVSTLENAVASLDNTQTNTAVNKLEASVNKIEAQKEKKFTAEEADALIAAAQWIIDNINEV